MTQHIEARHVVAGDRINGGDHVYDVTESALTEGAIIIAAGNDGVVYALERWADDLVEVDR